jgi:probable addiction module antidote protein
MTHMTPKSKKLQPFDAAKYLDSDQAIAAYIAEALATGEPVTIERAIGAAARACAMNPRK